jgi:hypothetical protein
MSFGSNVMPKRFGKGKPAKRKHRLCECPDDRDAAAAARKDRESSCPKCGGKKPRGKG